jgi:hypothetical protein
LNTIKIIFYIIISLFILGFSYSVGDKYISIKEKSDLAKNYPSFSYHSIGQNQSKGNIIGISINMTPMDYSNEEIFYSKLENILETIRSKYWLDEKTVLVFPEHFGTFLFLLDEKKSIYAIPSLEKTGENIFLHHPEFYIQKLLSHETTLQTIISQKSEKSLQVFIRSFSRLAKIYNVNIFSGSIVSKEIILSNGQWKTGNKSLLNQSLFFLNSGEIFNQIGIKKNISEFEAKKFGMVIPSNSNFLIYESIQFLLSQDTIPENFKSEIIISSSFFEASIANREKIQDIHSDLLANQKNRVFLQTFFKGAFLGFDFAAIESFSIRYNSSEKIEKKESTLINIWL